MSVLLVGLLGAGRMGQEILTVALEQPGSYRLQGIWARSGGGMQQLLTELAADGAAMPQVSENIDAVLAGAEVAIDFTLPEATARVVAAARKAGKPLVCGVSGLAQEDLQALHDAAENIPVFYARNMSIGIALLQQGVANASAVLGMDFDIEIDDLHHAAKRDAPSGTALSLGETAAAARGQDFATAMHYAPVAASASAPAKPGQIAFHVRREGQHPGAHEVRFANGQETVSFGHIVSNRRVFASGALRAAAWLQRQPPGFYGMQDLLEDCHRA